DVHPRRRAAGVSGADGGGKMKSGLRLEKGNRQMRTERQKLSPLQRAEQESRAGRLWRAKEILSGFIPNVGYCPKTFATYGRILLQMHDLKEAGKYLFLSGLAADEENEAVELFLQNLRGKPCGWIFSQFPGAGRKETLADYPERVQEELK